MKAGVAREIHFFELQKLCYYNSDILFMRYTNRDRKLDKVLRNDQMCCIIIRSNGRISLIYELGINAKVVYLFGKKWQIKVGKDLI